MLCERDVHFSFHCSQLSALRSAARGDLVVPRTRLQLGKRAFVWLVRSPGTVYHWTFVRHIHYQHSKTCSRHIYSNLPTSVTVLASASICTYIAHSSNARSAPSAAEKASSSTGNLKLAMLRSGSRTSFLLNEFQTVGPTTANARRPYASGCVCGTTGKRRIT